MKKSTHDGTCQLCGRLQALPNGKLAKHGYTTRWGFFSGTCPGSEHLPYEVSSDLLQDAMQRAQRAAAAEHEAANALAASTEPFVTVLVKDAATWANRKPVARWERVPVQSDGTFYYTVERFAHSSATVRTPSTHRIYGAYTMADAVRCTNEPRVAAHRTHAQNLREYAAWLGERIASWKPTALKARKADGAAKQTTVRTPGADVEVFVGGGRWERGVVGGASSACGMRFIWVRLASGKTVNVRQGALRLATQG